MNSIGIRELSENVSRHLRSVREGHTIVITDHGKAIARIIPAGPNVLERLISEGRVAPARTRRRRVPEPATDGVAGTVSDLVTDQRR